MVTNKVFEDPRDLNTVFVYTDSAFPVDSVVNISGTNARISEVFTSAEGWNPGVTSANQGVIGFNYENSLFEYGDPFTVTNGSFLYPVSGYQVMLFSYAPSGTSIKWYNQAGFGGTESTGDLATFNSTANYNNVLSLKIQDVPYITSVNNLYALSALQSLWLDCNLTSLDVYYNFALGEFLLYYSPNLTTVNVSNNLNLFNIIIASTSAASLDFTNNINLQSLLVNYNSNLSTLTIPTSSKSANFFVDASDNVLTTFNASGSGATYLKSLYLTNNLLTQSAVDQIYIDKSYIANAYNQNNGFLYTGGTGNAAVTSASLAARNNLVSRGWTLVYNT